MNFKKYAILIIILLIRITEIYACTIFSAKDKNGHIWAGNNEDYIFTFRTYLNIASASDSTLGYIFFSYFSPDGTVEGGTNEAGLFFDFNAIPETEYKDYSKKKDYPGGHNALMHYLLKNCKTVEEAFTMFRKYRDPDLRTSQMHLADKFGNLGIILADSMWITKADFQVSTNYNLCHEKTDSKACWRFPIAE